MDINLMHSDIIDMYQEEGMTMRSIAKILKTNHKMISRILKLNGVSTRRPKNSRALRKFPCDIDLKYNNMVTHLKWNVSIEWAKQFKDFEKLKFLNRSISNRDDRYPFTTEEYKYFIEKFYYDDSFNMIYSKWMNSGRIKYLKPSVDHIYPRSKGGNNKLSNLRFLTWFENRCKNDMTQKEWDNIKNNLKDYFI